MQSHKVGTAMDDYMDTLGMVEWAADEFDVVCENDDPADPANR